MKMLGMEKWLVVMFLGSAFFASTSHAIATCPSGLDGAIFSSVGDCYESGPTNHIAGGVAFAFTIVGSEITGLRLSGEQTAAGTNFTILQGGEVVQTIITGGGQSFEGLFDSLSVGNYSMNIFNTTASGDFNIALTAVPIPAAVWLFGSVLMALGVVGRKRRLGQTDQAAMPA